MKAVFTGCLMLAIAAVPAYAQTVTKQQNAEAMNCPPMANAETMQKQMGAMMSDMRTMMDRASDPATKARMQAMHERMSAMMANMQMMHQGRMTPGSGTEKPETPATPPAPDGNQDHDGHHPGQ